MKKSRTWKIAIITLLLTTATMISLYFETVVEAPVQAKAPIKVASQKKATPKPITLTFTGDVLLDRSIGENIRTKGVDYPFRGVSSLLKKADLTFVNLETAVSKR